MQAAAECQVSSQGGENKGVSPPLIHVLLAILAAARQVKSTLLSTYGGRNLVHQLNAYCTIYTFCFISGPSRAANACKLGNLLCSKNYGQEKLDSNLYESTPAKKSQSREKLRRGLCTPSNKGSSARWGLCQPSFFPFSPGFRVLQGASLPHTLPS